ncbi:MAG: A24 family peptidase [Candidatus Diapherotrites archaeon]
MEFLLLREIVLLVALGIAAYTDWKTGYIYDWISYPLIAIGGILSVVEFSTYGIWPFAVAAIVFGIGYLFYYFGKLGGGDVKLFAGVALILPLYNGTLYVIPLLFYSALAASTVLGVYYGISYYRKGIDWKLNQSGVRRATLLGAAFLLYFVLAAYYNVFPLYLLTAIIIPILIGLVFVAFEQGIRKEFFLKEIPLQKAEEDEILELDKLSKSAFKALKGKTLLDGKEKKALQKMGIEKIWVYRNLPKFAPFILLAALLLFAFPQFAQIFTLVG